MNHTELIAAVREHALKNYEQGWDVVVETYEDDEIAEVIGKARTVQGAVHRMAKAIEPYNERRQEIEATADKDESIYVPHTYLSLEEALEVVEGEEEAHSIANAVTAGTRSAERHADLFPSWEMITTESGAYFSTDNDVVRRHIADQRHVLGMYLSGEWSLGTDLGLSLGMCRDQAFVIRLMELELHRREQEAEKSHVNDQGRQAAEEPAFDADNDCAWFPPNTETGIVCGKCTHRDEEGDRVVLRHATVADVRCCYEMHQQLAQQQEAELEAERLVERHFEEGF